MRTHDAIGKRLHQRWTGAPDDVEARNRISMAGCCIAASFRPLHEREPTHTEVMQPATLFTSREVYVGFSPAARPVVLRPIKGSAAQPVGQRQLDGVMDSQPTLLSRIDHKKAAQGPVRLAPYGAERLGVQHDHRPISGGQLVCGDETG